MLWVDIFWTPPLDEKVRKREHTIFFNVETRKEKKGSRKLVTNILLFGTAIGVVLGLSIKEFKAKR